MAECHHTSTPIGTRAKLPATDGELLSDATEYMSLASTLQYLTMISPTRYTRPVFICMLHAWLTVLLSSEFFDTFVVLWNSASSSSLVSNSRLVWQCFCHLYVSISSTKTSTNQAHQDQYSFHLRKGVPWWSLSFACSLLFTFRR
jgi:hypothetical protein